MSTHALYRFYNASEDLLYVGITLDPGSRWKTHSKEKPWWHEVARVDVQKYATRDAVLEAERAAIIAERPRYNVVHNGLSSRGSQSPVRWDTYIEWTPESMPDMCHDYCVKADPDDMGMYFPYQWFEGRAKYECTEGHRWTCGWGTSSSGSAPENRGVDQSAQARRQRAVLA